MPKLFADETTAPVLDPGRGRTKTSQLWAYARDERSWGGTDPPDQRRPHQGRGMNGRTPAAAFVEGLPKPHQQKEDKRAEKRTTKQSA